MFTRYIYDDITLFGHHLTRGTQIGCLLAAAGRDPVAYPDPGRFSPGRAGPANLAFGAGPHFCVGRPLARLELQIALSTLFSRRPNLRLEGDPQYRDHYHFHGLDRLQVSG